MVNRNLVNLARKSSGGSGGGGNDPEDGPLFFDDDDSAESPVTNPSPQSTTFSTGRTGLRSTATGGTSTTSTGEADRFLARIGGLTAADRNRPTARRQRCLSSAGVLYHTRSENATPSNRRTARRSGIFTVRSIYVIYICAY